ncbi:hypothetical protein [Azospirillum doebereinerae]
MTDARHGNSFTAVIPAFPSISVAISQDSPSQGADSVLHTQPHKGCARRACLLVAYGQHGSLEG